jgi:hypothetical protein
VGVESMGVEWSHWEWSGGGLMCACGHGRCNARDGMGWDGHNRCDITSVADDGDEYGWVGCRHLLGTVGVAR